MHYVVGYVSNGKTVSEKFSDSTEAHEQRARLTRRLPVLGAARIFLKVEMTEGERQAVRKLLALYGKRGKKHTLEQESWIKGLLESGEDRFKEYRKGITRDCEHAVLRALGRMV